MSYTVIPVADVTRPLPMGTVLLVGADKRVVVLVPAEAEATTLTVAAMPAAKWFLWFVKPFPPAFWLWVRWQYLKWRWLGGLNV